MHTCNADRGPFDEGAAQVKKLLTRDKRELMGVEQIGQRARTEFDEDDSAPSTSGADNGSGSKPSTRLFGEGNAVIILSLARSKNATMLCQAELKQSSCAAL